MVMLGYATVETHTSESQIQREEWQLLFKNTIKKYYCHWNVNHHLPTNNISSFQSHSLQQPLNVLS